MNNVPVYGGKATEACTYHFTINNKEGQLFLMRNKASYLQDAWDGVLKDMSKFNNPYDASSIRSVTMDGIVVNHYRLK